MSLVLEYVVALRRKAPRPLAASYKKAKSKDSNTDRARLRIRYATELLAGPVDESFRHELYVIFAEVQEKLGKINDCASAVTMFNEWRDRADDNGSQAELAELIAREKTQLDAECQGFRES